MFWTHGGASPPGRSIDPLEIPLRDIHLPEAVSWWPPAWGWWLLPLALAVLGWLAWRLLRGRRARVHESHVRRAALSELDAVELRFRASADPRAAVAAVSVLMRRFALGLAPREEVAALTGRRWEQWLQERCAHREFQGAAALLAEMPYRPDPQVDVPALLARCRAFIGSVPIGGRSA